MFDGFFALRPNANVHKTPCERNCARMRVLAGFGLGGASHGIRKQENKRSFQSVVSQLIKKTTAALQVRTDQAHVLCLLKLL